MEGFDTGISCCWMISSMDGRQCYSYSFGRRTIMGCGNNNFLHLVLIHPLHACGFFTLNEIMDDASNDIWNQGRRSETKIGLLGELTPMCEER